MSFQSRKRFRHCWSPAGTSELQVLFTFQSRKRFRHCWSRYNPIVPVWFDDVSIAKAIPSLLEHVLSYYNGLRTYGVSIAKAIPSLLELGLERREAHIGPVSIAKAIPSLLERRQLRHCHLRWRVSIAKAIPSLLEHGTGLAQGRSRYRFNRESDSVTVGARQDDTRLLILPVSIAKAIPSLLEHVNTEFAITFVTVSIAKAIPSLLEPETRLA